MLEMKLRAIFGAERERERDRDRELSIRKIEEKKELKSVEQAEKETVTEKEI